MSSISDKTRTKPEELPEFYALIAAAGSGARFGANTPKQYIKIAGKTLLRHALDAFLSHPKCRGVKVIINPQDAKSYHETVSDLKIEEHSEGSSERNLSIYNGLKDFSKLKNKDIILIHDAARPCITHHEINALLTALQETPAATLTLPVSATIARGSKEIEGYTDRTNASALQTPQGFRYGDILTAHENAPKNEIITDDTALVKAQGIKVTLVQGSPGNIKVTHPQDLDMAETLLKARQTTRTGQGFDVHAFDQNAAGPVRLCGIDIDHPHKLKGHSDADVGLHALTDAILGAIGEGDIGQHFPPSDDSFKNMDSAIFLQKAMEILREKGGELINADITLICEAPKIGPHANTMKNRIAEICAASPDQINIKATTTEQLGFTGRGEGIAAQSIATIKL